MHGNTIDLTNKRFGRLIAISVADKDKFGHYRWNCVCDCGNEKKIQSSGLISGHIQSCGCLHRELTSKRKKKTFGYASFVQVYGRYKNSAKKRGICFELSKEEFYDICLKDCFYCGTKPNQKEHKLFSNGDFLHNGIDRRNNKDGYTLDNAVPCCKNCNRAKNNLGYDEFILWLDNLADYRIRKSK